MPKGIYAAASAMITETRLLESTARNIAHAQTPGYRREGALRIGFADVLAGQGRTGIAGTGGSGVLSDGSYFTFSDGVREDTGAPTDIALSGDGFFAVQDKAGKTWLTRDGNFQLDAQNRLVTREGQMVMGQGGPVTIPEDAEKVVIDGTGSISTETTTSSGVVRATIDQLRLVNVAKPRAMVPSNGVYFDPAEQTLSDAKPTVHQGQLERGNVNPVDELVELVSLQRRYDAAQRAISEQNRAGQGFSDILRG